MPNPMPAETVNLPSEVKRRVLCSRYSGCLEICLSKGWQGFCCSECPDFELERPEDRVHWAQQGKNSGWLLMNAGYLPKWIANQIRNWNGPDEFFRVFSE